jgi:hypothetical protein
VSLWVFLATSCFPDLEVREPIYLALGHFISHCQSQSTAFKYPIKLSAARPKPLKPVIRPHWLPVLGADTKPQELHRIKLTSRSKTTDRFVLSSAKQRCFFPGDQRLSDQVKRKTFQALPTYWTLQTCASKWPRGISLIPTFQLVVSLLATPEASAR